MLENDINDVLDLTFTEDVDYFGAVEMVELKPGGSSIKVWHTGSPVRLNSRSTGKDVHVANSWQASATCLQKTSAAFKALWKLAQVWWQCTIHTALAFDEGPLGCAHRGL
jgi:hypothetical protein